MSREGSRRAVRSDGRAPGRLERSARLLQPPLRAWNFRLASEGAHRRGRGVFGPGEDRHALVAPLRDAGNRNPLLARAATVWASDKRGTIPIGSPHLQKQPPCHPQWRGFTGMTPKVVNRPPSHRGGSRLGGGLQKGALPDAPQIVNRPHKTHYGRAGNPYWDELFLLLQKAATDARAVKLVIPHDRNHQSIITNCRVRLKTFGQKRWVMHFWFDKPTLYLWLEPVSAGAPAEGQV